MGKFRREEKNKIFALCKYIYIEEFERQKKIDERNKILKKNILKQVEEMKQKLNRKKICTLNI